MRSALMQAWEEFHEAMESRRLDLQNPAKAAVLLHAREALDQALAAALERVPYRTRHVADLRPGRDGGHVHLALLEHVSLAGWGRRSGQTVCGAIPGRPAPQRPVTCTACLRQIDRHVDAEPDPPELGL
jgi:hypothetical protein